MVRVFGTQDKNGDYWELQDALVMGYLDRPVVKIRGRGEVGIPPDALQELAVTWLRSHGWVCVHYEQVEDSVTRAVLTLEDQQAPR